MALQYKLKQRAWMRRAGVKSQLRPLLVRADGRSCNRTWLNEVRAVPLTSSLNWDNRRGNFASL